MRKDAIIVLVQSQLPEIMARTGLCARHAMEQGIDQLESALSELPQWVADAIKMQGEDE